MGSPSPPGMPGTFSGREGGAAGEDERGPVQTSGGNGLELAFGVLEDGVAGVVLGSGMDPSPGALVVDGGLTHFLFANLFLARCASCCSTEMVGGNGVSSVGVTVPESAVRGSSF